MYDGFAAGVIIGAIIFAVCYSISDAIADALHRRAIENIRKPLEWVASYNATVLIDERGVIGWVDNDAGVKKIRKKK